MQTTRRIQLVEPFLAGSHQQWAEGLRAHSAHEVSILGLPGRHWKWRMYGGAVALAAQANALPDPAPDLILATDMLDVATFLALCRRRLAHTPVALYFHENQVTYPWSPDDTDARLERNNQYGFINYTSALAADRVFFNSAFHRSAFLEALPAFLRQFPDRRGMDNVALIAAKSEVLPLGMDLAALDLPAPPPKPAEAVILWNHRWEYDKSPDAFFAALCQLKAEGLPFKLIVLGEAYQQSPPAFEAAFHQLADRILHFGYAPSRAQYAHYLHLADVLPVTSQQDFFGGSTVEAIYCGCLPLLPRRLAYPMHIPAAHHAALLYDTDAELLDKLRAAILDVPHARHLAGSLLRVRDFVAHCDWSHMAGIYDERLAGLM